MPELAHIEGLKELDGLLQALPEEIAKHVANSAVLAGAKVVRDEMIPRIPIGAETHYYRHRRKGKFTGALTQRPPGYAKTQIRAKLANSREFAEAAKILGVSRLSAAAVAGASPRAFYLYFLEFGWTHTGPKPNRKRGAHIPARPMLRPAFENSRDRAMQAIAVTLWDGIRKSAAKLTRDYYHSGFSKSGTFTRLLGLR